MCQSQLVLTPTDVYPWSYRFFEAIMCRCIPVLNDREYDQHTIEEGYFFYRVHDVLRGVAVWRKDWVDYNYAKFLEHHTF